MLENVIRHIEMAAVMEAALEGSGDRVHDHLHDLSLVAVFIPVPLLACARRVLHEFALTISAAISSPA